MSTCSSGCCSGAASKWVPTPFCAAAAAAKHFAAAPAAPCERTLTGFPLGLENLEKWEGTFQSGKRQGILKRLEKSGKITTISDKCYLLFF